MKVAGVVTGLSVLAIGAVRLGAAATTVAQGKEQAPQGPTQPVLSAGLLRRLAESADAYRTGDTVYLVASDSFPYQVVGGFPTAEQARVLVRSPGYHVYAVRTPADITGRPPVILTGGCYKNDITTQWVCPKLATAKAVRAADVRQIEVVFRLRNGDSMTVPLAADSISAMVFTVDAFDRFIAPYYLRLFGPAYVARMRESLLA